MTTKPTFEKSMAQLEKIVQELESEDLSLEIAIKKFEEGIKLSQFCNQKLDQSEKKINLLIERSDGELIAEPFDANGDESA
jgi:exodeoxyribonuclease VII small subunit